MRHVTRSWQATVLSGSAEYRGAKHTVVDRWLRVSAQKVSLASVDLPDRSHNAAVTTRSSTAAPVTSRVDHRGPTWPSASRFRPGTRDAKRWELNTVVIVNNNNRTTIRIANNNKLTLRIFP